MHGEKGFLPSLTKLLSRGHLLVKVFSFQNKNFERDHFVLMAIRGMDWAIIMVPKLPLPVRDLVYNRGGAKSEDRMTDLALLRGCFTP